MDEQAPAAVVTGNALGGREKAGRGECRVSRTATGRRGGSPPGRKRDEGSREGGLTGGERLRASAHLARLLGFAEARISVPRRVHAVPPRGN